MSGFIGGRELPPAVRLLGFSLTSADPERGVTEVAFVGRPEFLNLLGSVQGGFLCAMLDAAASTALLAQLPDHQFAPTIEMKTSFLRPAPAGPIVGRGRVVHRGGSIAFLEGSLEDPDGVLLATCTSTAKIVSR
jgi:uncharacterized protein (TIGR00369 family)